MKIEKLIEKYCKAVDARGEAMRTDPKVYDREDKKANDALDKLAFLGVSPSEAQLAYIKYRRKK